jgi:hypothetical protein
VTITTKLDNMKFGIQDMQPEGKVMFFVTQSEDHVFEIPLGNWGVVATVVVGLLENMPDEAKKAVREHLGSEISIALPGASFDPSQVLRDIQNGSGPRSN